MQSDIDMVSFSGTIKAGKKVYAGAAAAMKKVILENGGKDAALIDQDADLEQVVDQLLIGSLRHSGQLCSSIKRVYTHSKIYRQLIERLEEGIKKIPFGSPKEESTIVGPLKTSVQIERLNNYLSEAVGLGGRLIYGGNVKEGQFFYPTLIIDLTNGLHIMQEEVLGPVIPVKQVDSMDEAVYYANQSEYGLNASIWSADLSRAKRYAALLEVGTVTLNSLPRTSDHCSWHGIKKSGIGNILSPTGIKQFTNAKNIRYKR